MKILVRLLVLLFMIPALTVRAQDQRPVLSVSQLGYRNESPRVLTMIPASGLDMKDSIPFYIHPAGWNLPRVQKKEGLWASMPGASPFDIIEGEFVALHPSQYKYKGWLCRKESRWGTVWQADFSAFGETGMFQIETEMQFSLPFRIELNPYMRFIRGYMVYIHSQRSGYDIPGVRDAQHLDDGQMDEGGNYHPVAGGWYNAGDLRKWMSLTQFNLEALYHIYVYGPDSYREAVIEEMQWGNRYFHQMISDEGQVFEDVGGGSLRPGLTYEENWWAENHPGCIADNAGNIFTDNIPESGDERIIRTTYNPFVQLAFVKNQALISTVLPALDASRSLYLAEKAWSFAQMHQHDQRTIYLAMELDAALELKNAGSGLLGQHEILDLLQQLLSRQDQGENGLRNYFLEKDARDAYRSVAFSCLPITSLLRALELGIINDEKTESRIEHAIAGYIDHFLLADAGSNPYGLTPYGVYIKKPYEEHQLYRDAGRGRGVRTFIHPFSTQPMIHGTNGVVMSQAFLLAKAGYLFQNEAWKEHAEKLLQWSTGHNPTGLSLFYGIGVKAVVPYSLVNLNIPQAATNGFIGREDDTPYLETSNAIQWNTQEIWDVPYLYAVGAAAFLGKCPAGYDTE